MDHVNPRDEQYRLRAAGEIIARAAKTNAARFSRRIPEATRVVLSQARPNSVSVVTDGRLAPNAAPFEYAEHHPLFGNRNHWYRQPHRPYLEDAAVSAADAAVEEFANVVDDWCKDLGFS